MGKFAVVVSFDEVGDEETVHLAIDVANLLRPLFLDKQQAEIHLARKDTAADIVHILADRRMQ